MKRTFFILFLLVSIMTNAQGPDGTELGVDAYFGASTNGGNLSLGLKYGFNFGENYIIGPSFRYQRTWNNNVLTGNKSGFNVFGGGVFGHVRLYNLLFLGAEFETMRTPLSQGGLVSITNSSWIPTLFLGGGYSQEFNEKIRINAGVMYDVVNHVQSPFQQGYFLRKANGALIPMIYRIAFFFPLT